VNLVGENETTERQILKHDPWPGYRRIFYIVLALTTLYLFLIFYFGHKPH